LREGGQRGPSCPPSIPQKREDALKVAGKMFQNKQNDQINKELEKAESPIPSSFKGIYEKIVSKREYLSE
jgi:hypothetical protein